MNTIDRTGLNDQLILQNLGWRVGGYRSAVGRGRERIRAIIFYSWDLVSSFSLEWLCKRTWFIQEIDSSDTK